MKQARMMGVKNFQVFDVEEPKVTQKGEALLKVCGTSICGSDMHPWIGESIRATYDRVPGHEFCGIIEDICSDRTDLKPGDKVVVNPAVPCGTCEACMMGNGYICEHNEVIGGERPGAFCEKIVVPVQQLHKLPDDIDMTYAALVEPVAFAEHCTHGLYGNVLVIGLGAIGLSCAMLLHYHGCNVIGMDINEHQLATAKELCCDYVINSREGDPEAKVKEIVGGRKIDFVVDAVFNEWSVNFNIKVLKKGGHMIEIGVPVNKLFPFNSIGMLCSEITMETRYLYNERDFNYAVDYVANNKIDFHPFITKVFPLEKIQEAFEWKYANPSLKVILQANKDLQ